LASKSVTDVELVAAYLRWLAIARGCSPRTVQSRKYISARWLKWLAAHGSSLATATRHDVLAWMPDNVAASARKNYLGALTGLHEWLVDEGYRTDNPVQRVTRPIQHRQVPRAISDEEAEQVWERCTWNARPAIGLAMMCGLRCQEISGAKWEDISWGPPTTLMVSTAIAKGGHERRVIIPDELGAVLRSRQVAAGWLARGPQGNGSNPELMSQWLSRVLRDECSVNASGHQLRHWYAGAMLRRGANLKIVQDALGHASLATTGLYLKMTISDQAAYAVALTPRREAS
jgi:site-specific recombinase XerD